MFTSSSMLRLTLNTRSLNSFVRHRIKARVDTRVYSDSDTPSGQDGRVKSPGSRRVIRRRRTEEPVAPLVYEASPAATSTIPGTGAPRRSPGPDPFRLAPTTASDEQALLLSALESMLARAVATTGVLQLEGSDSPSYPPAIHQLVRTLSERVAGKPAAPIPPPTFADVARTPVTTTRADLASVNPHPAKPHPHAGHQPPPSAKHRKKNNTARRQRGSAQHLIVRWAGDAPDPSLHSESDIVAAISATECLDEPAVHAVSWTSSGNLALHVAKPHTAEQLAPAHGRIREVLSRLWDLEDDPDLDLDLPWSKVVIHGVPQESYFAERSRLWEYLQAQGYALDGMTTAAAMVKAGPEPGRLISLKVSFKDPAAAERMLRDRGIVVFQTFCHIAPTTFFHTAHVFAADEDTIWINTVEYRSASAAFGTTDTFVFTCGLVEAKRPHGAEGRRFEWTWKSTSIAYKVIGAFGNYSPEEKDSETYLILIALVHQHRVLPAI
ncbi:hypothetical protein MKEN_00558800 [Mycena kentingensis (nom. inval.)]|nr:hypothetical protein MKEN_00558800 [Mycena kentingensis (nom. inval.)]